MRFIIKHNENEIEYTISNLHIRLGEFQDEIFKKCLLCIYDVEYVKLYYKNNKEVIFGEEEISDYIQYVDSIFKNLDIQKEEDIEYIFIQNRLKDENGFILNKKNIYIENYNKYLVKMDEEHYDKYFTQMIEEDNLNSRISIQPYLDLFRLTQLTNIPMIHNQRRSFHISPSSNSENQPENDLEYDDQEEDDQEEEEEEEDDQEEEEEEENEINIIGNVQNENMRNIVENIERNNNMFVQSLYSHRREHILTQAEQRLLGMINSPYNQINVPYQPLSITDILNNINNESNDNQNIQNNYRIRYQFSNSIELPSIGTLLNMISGVNHNFEDVKVILSEEEYNKMDKKKYYECNKTEENKCVICNDEFKEEDDVRITHCNHIMHDECLKPWLLKESTKCPFCRMDLRKDDIEE